MLRKHCIRFGIPLPPRGYWEKLKAGKSVYKSALPKVTGELKKHVRNYVIKYKHDVKNLKDEELESGEGMFLLTDDTKNYIKETCSKIEVKSQLREPHPLIVEHQEEMKYRKSRDKAVERAGFNYLYQARIKNQYREDKPVLPIFVSADQLKRAYRIMDALIKTLPHLESWVSIGGFNDKKDQAYINVMHVSFKFELKEAGVKQTSKNKAKHVEVTSEQVVRPLVLSVTSNGSSWNREYTEHFEHEDTPSEPLETKLNQVITDLFIVANRVLAREELHHRELERKWAEEERQYQLKKLKRREEEKVKILETLVLEWDQARKIREFAESLESSVNGMQDSLQKQKILDRARWIKEKADWLDPLIVKEDELLGKRKNALDLFEDE
ncbi:hypothetical protein LBW89_02650 [Paenibacillus sp. alder61]|uniref:hypothetical protein n=1 Tax=Paenibacillus sp. alder61 TaxID=2862948 RepID=UPI001CD7D06C|nr:hypothetical protein [Paenibacillus sp. alder61]MCA1291912.1 hypothetical protein [Paenibacillus sp. alder61]